MRYTFLKFGLVLSLLLLVGCTSIPRSTSDGAAPPTTPPPTPTHRPSTKPVQPSIKKGGGYYKDDGPAEEIPENLDRIPDAEPRWEPLHRAATRPYEVLGKRYVPNSAVIPYKARGIASWYGKKFHGQKTSIGEPYNMFAMTAAHTTLALPSYVRVTNPRNNRAVVVRITDRGPFHVDRVIDLSYTAAYKLGIINSGSAEVEVEAIIPPGVPGAIPPPSTAASASSERDDISELLSRLPRDENLPVAALARGVYLQLGAFSNADNAENLRHRLGSELDWLKEPLSVQVGAGIHRLQLGPYPNRNDAERVAERIRQALGYKPSLLIR